MKTLNIDHDKISISLDYNELYVILQCIAETRDARNDGDIEAILGITKEGLRALAHQFNDLKQKMDAIPSS